MQRYVDAHARADSDAVVAMMREDVRFTMPPQPTLFEGRTALAGFFAEVFGSNAVGEFRLVPTRANRQPAAANYLRAWGDTEFRALSLDVLRFAGGQLVEITTFEPALFTAFGLPEDPPVDRLVRRVGLVVWGMTVPSLPGFARCGSRWYSRASPRGCRSRRSS